MSRRKLKLAFIDHVASRRAKYQKRASTLKQKVNELSTLCDVDACVVIYNPHELGSEPLFWPDLAQAKEVSAKFMMIPEVKRCQNRVDLKEYGEKELSKVKQQLEKLKKENKNKMAQAISQCSVTEKIPDLSLEHLNSLKEIVDELLAEMQKGHNGILIG